MEEAPATMGTGNYICPPTTGRGAFHAFYALNFWRKFESEQESKHQNLKSSPGRPLLDDGINVISHGEIKQCLRFWYSSMTKESSYSNFDYTTGQDRFEFLSHTSRLFVAASVANHGLIRQSSKNMCSKRPELPEQVSSTSMIITF